MSSTDLAIALNNFAVKSLADGEGKYHGAMLMLREAIQYIKISLSSENSGSDENWRNSNSRSPTVVLRLPLKEIQGAANVSTSPIMVQVITNCSPCPTEALSRNGMLMVYPMIIDDVHTRYTGQRHKEQYLAHILMYNLALVNLVATVSVIKDIRSIARVPVTVRDGQSEGIEVASAELLRLDESLQVFLRSLKFIKSLVDPYIDDIFNPTSTIDRRSTAYDVQDHNLYRKYIILMILVTSQLMEMVRLMNLPHHYYDNNRALKNELQSILTFIELFILPSSSFVDPNDTYDFSWCTISAAA